MQQLQNFLAVAKPAKQGKSESSKGTNFFAACSAAWNCPPFRSCNPLNQSGLQRNDSKDGTMGHGWHTPLVQGNVMQGLRGEIWNPPLHDIDMFGYCLQHYWQQLATGHLVLTFQSSWHRMKHLTRFSLLSFQLIGIQASTSWTLWAAPSWKQGRQDQTVRLVASRSLTLSRSGRTNLQEYGKIII